MKLAAFTLLGTLWASVTASQTLNFPSNATLLRETSSAVDSYAMPIGPWVSGGLPVKTEEGHLTQQAWRISATGLTSLQLVRPVREQLRNDGFEILFECKDQVCGGFDFRFSTPVLPPPDMQVNLGDFRYLAASRDTDQGAEIISIIASRSANAGFVQVTRVGAALETVSEATAGTLRASPSSVPPTDFAASLSETGHAILSGLTFETGSSQLADGSFDALQALADYLAAQPDLSVALVGHTDASGSLDGNIALSKLRAGSVLERLVSDYGVARRQLDAQGMGYLSPIASNQTQEGRDANRRVEVIVTSTQ